MPALTEARIAELLAPFCPLAQDAQRVEAIVPQLSVYLDLLLRWNSRTNLTAIREPEEIVRRHFGESLFTAAALRSHLPEGATLLDFGSGAGFPGLPVQLFAPEWRCTLSESQGKKAAFLREASRAVGAEAEIWSGRVEAMPSERRFDCVALRAVDNMDAALPASNERIAPGGMLAVLAGGMTKPPGGAALNEFGSLLIPESELRMLYLYTKRQG